MEARTGVPAEQWQPVLEAADEAGVVSLEMFNALLEERFGDPAGALEVVEDLTSSR